MNYPNLHKGGGVGGLSTAKTHIFTCRRFVLKLSDAHHGAGARLVDLPSRTGRAVVLVADGEPLDPLGT